MKQKYNWKSHIKNFDKINNINLGKGWSSSYLNDPKTLLFCLSRYKFVSKMLVGKKKRFRSWLWGSTRFATCSSKCKKTFMPRYYR